MSNKGTCPNCNHKVAFIDSIKATAISTNIHCANCQAKLNISKIVIVLSVIATIFAGIFGYPIGRMYASEEISLLSILVLFILGLAVIQIIYFLMLCNSKLELAKV